MLKTSTLNNIELYQCQVEHTCCDIKQTFKFMKNGNSSFFVSFSHMIIAEYHFYITNKFLVVINYEERTDVE